MILAAGKGERMRPLTLKTPKPLLRVNGIPLLEHHLRRLAEAGVQNVIVNVSHLADAIVSFVGDGSRWGLSISISREETPLETAGGIAKALPLLGNDPFLVVSGDIFSDYDYAALLLHRPPQGSAHLVMVDNPIHHQQGDYGFEEATHEGNAQRFGLLVSDSKAALRLTYSGIGVFSPDMFHAVPEGAVPLRPLLDEQVERGRLTAEYFAGRWSDIGTPARLDLINREFDQSTGTR